MNKEQKLRHIELKIVTRRRQSIMETVEVRRMLCFNWSQRQQALSQQTLRRSFKNIQYNSRTKSGCNENPAAFNVACYSEQQCCRRNWCIILRRLLKFSPICRILYLILCEPIVYFVSSSGMLAVGTLTFKLWKSELVIRRQYMEYWDEVYSISLLALLNT